MELITKFKKNYNKRKKNLNEEGLSPYLFNSSGYVLIIVLIITTLLVSIASEFIIVTQTNIGYIRKLNNRLKAGYLAKSGVQLAKFILYADKMGVSSEMFTGKSTDKKIDSFNDIWAIEMPEIPMEEGSLQLKITDENSKINLSIFGTEGGDRTKFYYFAKQFFFNMGLSTDLADIIHDWVDPDDSRMPYGAESSNYYQTLIPPYSAKNNAMDSIDEMLLLKGITPEIYYGLGGGDYGLEKNLVEHNRGNVNLNMEKIMELTGISDKGELPESESNVADIGIEKSRRLSDYFTVYGNRRDYESDLNKININTASFRVLSALTENMTPDTVTEIINKRLIKPFTSVYEISDIIDDETITRRLSVKSFIFKIISIATVGNAKVEIIAVYNRTGRKILYWCEK